MSDQHHHFHYIELPSTDNEAMKRFYGTVFGWTFQDYGPSYVAILGAGVDGGFDQESENKPSHNGPLVILYSNDLEASEFAVTAAGGTITKPIFSFPGGRRFHFTDPTNNQLAVWTIVNED